MDEELALFENTVNHNVFGKLPIVAIFNKVDVFLEKLHRAEILGKLQGYDQRTDAAKAIKLFEERFRAKDRRPLATKCQLPLDFHVTAATDPDCFQATMKAVQLFLAVDGTQEGKQIALNTISKPIAVSSSSPICSSGRPSSKAETTDRPHSIDTIPDQKPISWDYCVKSDNCPDPACLPYENEIGMAI